MALEDHIFLGTSTPIAVHWPLEALLDHYAAMRDAIAATGHYQPEEIGPIVLNVSFVYSFNAYKAIGLLLPNLYHESAAVVLRQLWEVSLNMHWIAVDPPTRARDFCNYTAIEFRSLIKKHSNDSKSLDDFDELTSRFQERFHYNDARGRSRTRPNFSTASICDRANKLKGPWPLEYKMVYGLSSMHAHGAPGAILYAIFLQQYSHPEVRERNSAALIAMLSVNVMLRNVELLAKHKIIADTSIVRKAFSQFQSTVHDAVHQSKANQED